MDIEGKLDLISQVGEEILTVDDLRTLLETKTHPIAYNGFEPSGQMHIAQGVFSAINVNKLTKAGIKFKFWVADWFAWINNKLEGNLDHIKVTGKYFIELWKACGMNLDNIEFLWAHDVMGDQEYWKKVMEIGRVNTVNRITRCSQIMGRSEKDALSAAQIFYPCMQAADIFHLKADIAQLGMDQRKVNVLAREIGKKIGFYKPVAVHNHMLMGLTKPPEGTTGAEAAIAKKMSKSNPNSAIFMNDEFKVIQKKINKAFCPEKQVEDNPLLEYAKYIIFERYDTLELDRPEKFGGKLEVQSYEELEKEYRAGNIHPADLKQLITKYIDLILQPVRNHFEKNAGAKKLYEEVQSFKVTR